MGLAKLKGKIKILLDIDRVMTAVSHRSDGEVKQCSKKRSGSWMS
jgi:hypothetical protein